MTSSNLSDMKLCTQMEEEHELETDPGFWFVVVKGIRYSRLNNAFHDMESMQF